MAAYFFYLSSVLTAILKVTWCIVRFEKNEFSRSFITQEVYQLNWPKGLFFKVLFWGHPFYSKIAQDKLLTIKLKFFLKMNQPGAFLYTKHKLLKF